MTFSSEPSHLMRKSVAVSSPAGAFAATLGVTEALRAGSLTFFLDSPISPGTPVELRFDMPTQAGQGCYPVQCAGKVLRAEWWAGRYAITVGFRKIEIMAGARCACQLAEAPRSQLLPSGARPAPSLALLREVALLRDITPETAGVPAVL